jgi:glycosyltransferase involved in cell wall biosynthesis
MRIAPTAPSLTIFLPVCNEIDSMPDIELALNEMNRQISSLGGELEILIHDNMSTDGSWEFLQSMSTRLKIRAYKMRKNIGYQESLALAFDHANGDAFAILQSDLQDPPELIIEMYQMWLSGAKSIVGIPQMRHESLKDKLGRSIFVKIFKGSSDLEKFNWFTDFYLLDRSIYKNYSGLPLINQFIRGRLVNDFVFEFTVPYVRHGRKKGTSKFSFGRKYTLAIDALLLHSQKLIRRMVVIGICVSFLFFVTSLGLLLLSFLNVLDPSKLGLYGIASLILFNMTMIISLFGISFEYLSRMHSRLHASSLILENREDLAVEKIN